MSSRSRLTAWVVLVLVVGAILVTCSDDSPTEPDSSPGTIDTITVTPVTSSSPAAGWAEITGLPAGNDSIYGLVLPTTKQAIDTGYAVVLRTDSGDYLVTPLHPTSPGSGGDVIIVLTDGSTVISQQMPMTIDTLPEAPGETAAIVEFQKQLLAHQLRIRGYSMDSLSTLDPGDIPLQHLSYFVAYDGLSSPGNPNCLEALLAGTAPMIGGNTPDWDLIDRLLAQTGYRAYLEDFVASLDTMSADSTPLSTSATLRNSAMSLSSSACIPGPDLGISDCGSLAAAMSRVGELQKAARSAADKVVADAASNTLLVIGLIPGGGAAAAAMAGGVLWIDAKIAEGQGNLYPSIFLDGATSFDPSVTEFPEDFIEDGAWTEFNVSATSLGWKLDKVVLESILQALSAKGGHDALGDVPPQLGDFVDGLDESIKAAVVGPGTDHVVSEFAGGSDILEICPNTWSNINCAGESYSDVTISSGQLEVDEAAQTYKPTAIGSAVMRIETNSSFGEENTGTAVSISTEEIEVFIDPFQATADTSEEINFTVRVENAVDERVFWTLEGGGSLPVSDFTSATVKTPSSEWDPPLKLKAESLAETGLRESAGDKREDEASITYEGGGLVVISPRTTCIKPGEDDDFTVSYSGGAINTVRWETDPAGVGTISGSGTTINYSAPGNPAGQITLKAVVNEEDSGYAYIDVSSCVCYWTFEGSGSGYFYEESGEWSEASDLGALQVKLRPTENHDGWPLVWLIVYNATDTGTYDAAALSFTVADDLDWGMADTSQAPPTVKITQYVSGDYVEGSVSGVLSHRISFNPLEYEYINVSVTFRAEFFDLYRPRCVDDSLR